jgi:hypothetical protein
MSWRPRDQSDSLSRRKAHAIWDRARTLARQGKTDEQIAEELQLPLINIKAMTASVRESQSRQID